MTSFFGQYSINLDAQNRVVVPFRLREELITQSPLYISKGIEDKDTYLIIYPHAIWERLSAQINLYRNLKDVPQPDRLLRKHLYGTTHPLEIDSNNRALLPTELRTYAKLNKKILLIGMQDVVEIWDEDIWNASSKTEDLHKVLTKGAKEGIHLY
ncbi:MAG: cell division/cell wall cluster transcriptional repressor MraZ [Candidatus Portiera sp.]|nr:cell division/cell wall cluster transcriptional repressor MraZ [Portiera sp.]